MSDSQRDSFYLGALLHDIGKFIERAKDKEWQEEAELYVQTGEASKNHAHRRYSAAFIRIFGHFLSDPDIERYVLLHHGGWGKGNYDYGILRKDVPLKLIHIADVSSSKEREQIADLEPQYYARARLQSIFSDIRLGDKESPVKYLDLNKLSLDREALFPAGEDPVFNTQVYNTLVEDFELFFEKFIGRDGVDSTADLLPFLQKFLNAVPAQTPSRFKGQPDRPDINLLDHSRVTAAIALCLYDEWKEGSWEGRDSEILKDSAQGYKSQDFPAPCLLVSGDISGIQDFIFNVPSKGAAKTLKARSFFVQMLADVCIEKIQHDLDLKPSNLLYNGGGQFYFLVPKCKAQDLSDCKNDIARALIDEELSLSIASVEVKVCDFMDNFGKKWKKVNDTLAIEKLRKFKGLDGDEFGKIFGSFKQKLKTNDKRDRFFSITGLLRSNEYSIAASDGDSSEQDGWRKVLANLGYTFRFANEGSGNSPKNPIVFNETVFEGKYAGFRFSVKKLPRWSDVTIKQFEQELDVCGRSIEEYQDEDENGVKRKLKDDDIITYSHLAFKAYKETGTHKLGILKMDVDNLGKLFSDGFPKEIRTPSRMMSLSRSLQWFFEGYMNTILQEDEFMNYIYPIFSGGDDLFMVGAWHKVFDIALRIQKDFREFVCQNPSVTLSASLLVVDEHYPVSRFAVLAEERLLEAKYASLNKNAVNVFGQTLSWEEFGDARNIKDKLVRMVKDFGESRAIIQKVLQGCNGLGIIYKRAVRQRKASSEKNLQVMSLLNKEKPVGEKVWRMAWFLRDLEQELSKPIAEEIIGEYERVVFAAMNGEIVNPMKIAIGARWAEFSCRKSL
ncbi:MAG: type III-A CRISPR-associated protein Cas10/Csm1 [Chlorobium limicola]|nr:type III-A CRISPR-associated protein Cas10/Csm1 [Chlorobiaceae bacterium]NTV07428.1 type III-A CRISPR-associated protein Cas10/Csm1 [Chlorobium limicola]